MILRDGHFRIKVRFPFNWWDGLAAEFRGSKLFFLTVAFPNWDKSPLPLPRGPEDKTVEVRRDRILCMLDESKNGTLPVCDVFGIDPPWGKEKSRKIFNSLLCLIMINREYVFVYVSCKGSSHSMFYLLSCSLRALKALK